MTLAAGHPLLLLAAAALVGRLLLGLLPPGEPGRSSPREASAVLAAALVLGLMTLEGQARLFELSFGWSLLLPWILLALVRLALAPHAMLPRHEVLHDRLTLPWRLTRGAALLALLFAVLVRARTTSPAENAIHAALEAAVLLALESALSSFRIKPQLLQGGLLAGAVWLVLHATPAPRIDASLSLATLALGLSGLARWSHAADRRGRALLVLLALGHALVLQGPPGVPVALALGLLAGTAAPRLKQAALLSGLILATTLAVFLDLEFNPAPAKEGPWLPLALVALAAPLEALTRGARRIGRTHETKSLRTRALLVSAVVVLAAEGQGFCLIGHLPTGLVPVTLGLALALGPREDTARKGIEVEVLPYRTTAEGAP